MIRQATLATLYDYHYWATDRLLSACEALTAEQWERPMGHSWGSVHGVLAHMLAAEILWLARWRGHSPRALRQAAEFPRLADVRAAWTKVELEVRAFLRACNDVSVHRAVEYTTTQGVPHTDSLAHLLLHVANHGTHHRGELAAMLALLQVAHPEDDLLFYLRETRASR